MMESVEQHQLITVQHNMKEMKHANNQQKKNLVITTLGPNYCDLNIVDHSEDRQTDVEETVHEAVIKTEHNNVSVSVEEDPLVIKEEKSNADCVEEEFDEDLIKFESALYTCTVCYEEFHDEHTYSAHVSTHQFNSHDGATSADSALTEVDPLSWRPVKTENEARATVGTDTTQRSARAPDSKHRTTSERHLVVELYDDMKYHENVVPKQEVLTQARQAVSVCDSLNACTAHEDAQCRAVAAAHEPAASTPTATGSRTRKFTCQVCDHVFKQENTLIAHMRSHTGETCEPYSCELCIFKCIMKCTLDRHMLTHTGEKPYSCKLCIFKCSLKGSLDRHMRTHTGEKPYSCKLCIYKCSLKGTLDRHMRTHTGEKPYSCDICSFQCAQKGSIVRHSRTHTGEKPFSCEICSFKCAEKGSLARHMRTHTGEKPYSCEKCRYKCTQKSSLQSHVRTQHTGKKNLIPVSHKCTAL